MKIGVYGFSCNGSGEYIRHLFEELERNHIRAIVYLPFYELIKQECGIQVEADAFYENQHDLPNDIDFMISLGGDGSFLETVSIVGNREIPIIGINTGRLGFLATISKDEIAVAFKELIDKKYRIEDRSMIKLMAEGNLLKDSRYALNEISFQKPDATMVSIHVDIDGEYVNTYWADGLIISTPTGSTAYSLSAGGPIMVPQSKDLILIPLAPHNLNVRPLIVPYNSELTIRIDQRSPRCLVTVDSRSAITDTIKVFKVVPAEFKAKIIKLQSQSFYTTLRNKLMWGADKRN